jgi:magnesium chelatase subunit I
MSINRSELLELLRGHSDARKVLSAPKVDLGIADVEPFPFLAIVGQEEMKLALVLAVINPLIGGVLLVGSRGTAKTTAVYSLLDLLPIRRRSVCPEGCTDELLETNGMDAICSDCAERVGYGDPLTVEDRVRIVDLPLNARLEDVVGGINERVALEQQRVRLVRGILGQADGNVLHIDEVNLLDDAVADAILNAASQGFYTVRRGALNLRYRSRFLLIGSMNPAEGKLRPQIMDRFGLRAIVRGLSDPELRYRVYEQALSYHLDPERLSAGYSEMTLAMAQQIELARERLPDVKIGEAAKQLGLEVINELEIDSGRAEITLFEAARAYCVADERDLVVIDDIKAVAPLSIRFRQSDGLNEFFKMQETEDLRLNTVLEDLTKDIDSGSTGDSA